MQYSALRKYIDAAPSEVKTTVPLSLFRHLLAAAIRQKGFFDERFYIERYPDIAAAIEAKRIKSAIDHYTVTGFYENRQPARIVVDERYYLEKNPDVAEAIRRGVVKSAQDHFDNTGFDEGRLPFHGFSIF